MNTEKRIENYAKQRPLRKNRVNGPGHLVVDERSGEAIQLSGKQLRRLKKAARREQNRLNDQINEWVEKNEPREVVASATDGLEALTRDELRAMAAERDIKGRGSMNKAELVQAIVDAQAG